MDFELPDREVAGPALRLNGEADQRQECHQHDDCGHGRGYAHFLVRLHRCPHNRYRLHISAIGYSGQRRAGLRHKAIAVSPTRMGRPPLGIISTTVRLPRTILDRIDALMGANRRAQFIREAVEAELGRRERDEPDAGR